jgi:hypothetical protein
VAITFSKRAILATALFATAIAVATWFLLGTDDDRNPIRVKNKLLRIESEDKQGSWVKPGAAEKWKLDANNRKSASEYIVTTYGADGCIDVMRGTTVEIRYEFPNTGAQARTITFSLQLNGNKTEPVLDSSVPMTADNSNKVKKLRMTDDVQGAITRLVVGGTTCTFPTDRRVSVELCMHNCS